MHPQYCGYQVYNPAMKDSAHATAILLSFVGSLLVLALWAGVASAATLEYSQTGAGSTGDGNSTHMPICNSTPCTGEVKLWNYNPTGSYSIDKIVVLSRLSGYNNSTEEVVSGRARLSLYETSDGITLGTLLGSSQWNDPLVVTNPSAGSTCIDVSPTACTDTDVTAIEFLFSSAVSLVSGQGYVLVWENDSVVVQEPAHPAYPIAWDVFGASFSSTPTNRCIDGGALKNSCSTYVWLYAGAVTPSDTSTRISELSPVDAAVTASTTVSLDISYYANSTTDAMDTLHIYLYDVTRNFAPVFPNGLSTTDIVQDALTTYSTTTVLLSGHTYQFGAALSSHLEIGGFPVDHFVYSSAATTQGVGTDGTAQFSVIVNNLVNTIGASSTANLYTLATSTCAITNISGCFQNALAWAFYPDPQLLQLISQDGEQIKIRPPVGYIYATFGALSQIGATSTPAFTLTEDAPIMQYIFQPLVGLLTGAIWFLAVIGLFRRSRTIEI